MGTHSAKPLTIQKKPQLTAVKLHIYDVSPNLMEVNQALFQITGGGVFHAGVELFGQEWAYRNKRTSGTGIYNHKPLKAPGASHCMSLGMGMTDMTEETFYLFLHSFSKEWPASDYHFLRNNCCHFSKTLCVSLGCGSNFPDWLMTLADTGDNIAQSSLEGAKAVARFDRSLNRCLSTEMEECAPETNMYQLFTCCRRDDSLGGPTVVQVVGAKNFSEAPPNYRSSMN
mmetsp:Transcript_60530/g.116684  ORF Transcript_60530/g.116684 Transcript_60530/m.116684 type:complete len:228 (+) Transcript_60530:113-796(+)